MRFDTYLRYDDLSRALHALAAAHPALLRIESIGRSFEGRDIWLATLTNSWPSRGPATPVLQPASTTRRMRNVPRIPSR